MYTINYSSKVIQFKLAVKAKGKLSHKEMARKSSNANKDIAQLIVNHYQSQRK